MLDEKGNIFIIDAILAITLLLIVFLIFNYAIFIPNSDYSSQIKESQNAEDVMEILKFEDRRLAGKTAPSCGLYLRNVFY